MTIAMPTILDTHNVFEYLANLNYCDLADRDTSQVKIIPAKNFNLLISFTNGRYLLIKQEIHDDRGETNQEFLAAWRLQSLVKSMPELDQRIGKFLPELIYFDPDSSILIVNYLDNYVDLRAYYYNQNLFPIEIAKSIGHLLGSIHSLTFRQLKYQETLASGTAAEASYTAIDIIDRLTRITPQVFRIMPLDCLQFFKLFQRFPSLAQAIEELGDSITADCLVHNDLKLNNILLDLNWQEAGSSIIRLIDWERVNWGDPAFDLGCLLGSYLEIWLDGLVIDKTLTTNESLQLATTPLELLQPSLFTLVQSYLEIFPTILTARPDYLNRVVQFAGLSLIQRVEITIDEERIFGNRGIVMLQVAKQLLCTPQKAMNTLFGSNFHQLIDR